ncbi:MAG TPA: NYN domain-containing protein [bacterium]|nr:NYN domain-containing protein [bacterium]HOL55488.1 NYN domain-containing protein [bacterium]HPO82656.1 NYN domain-containing protein [bacterium]
MGRRALFIDGNNLYFVQRKLKWNVDFEKLLRYFRGESDFYNAFYYSGYDVNDQNQENFLKALTLIGYTVRKKPLKTISSQDNEEKQKSNMDVEMTLDLILTASHYDESYLFSGDGDFEGVIEYLRVMGKEIVVVSTLGHIAIELRNAADRYIDLSELKPYLEKIHI